MKNPVDETGARETPWGHVAGSWLYLLLACPLMHLFHGHGGHGRHGTHGRHGPDRGTVGG